MIIGDRKLSDIVAGVPSNFRADVKSFSNMYPFGMEQPGRYMESDMYRYGYNGMEKDSGATGDHLTTYFRQYDARLGRWWGIDPVTHPGESPYVAMGDNPISLTDPSGANPNGDPKGGAVTQGGGDKGKGEKKKSEPQKKGETQTTTTTMSEMASTFRGMYGFSAGSGQLSQSNQNLHPIYAAHERVKSQLKAANSQISSQKSSRTASKGPAGNASAPQLYTPVEILANTAFMGNYAFVTSLDRVVTGFIRQAESTVKSLIPDFTNLETYAPLVSMPLYGTAKTVDILAHPIATFHALDRFVAYRLGTPEGTGANCFDFIMAFITERASTALAEPVMPSTLGTAPVINPGGPAAIGRSENCVNCAIATDATFGGRPAMAMPGEETAHTVLEEMFGNQFQYMGSRSAIENTLAQSGPGARGIVAGVHSRGGHVFNAVVNSRGVVSFYDGQINGPAGPFNVYGNKLWFLRTN